MKLDRKKGIFTVAFKKTGGDSWSRPDPITVVASDYSHAKELAEEYFDLLESEKPVVNPDDHNSLAKPVTYFAEEIKLITDLVIY